MLSTLETESYIIVTNTINRPLWLVERSLHASLAQRIPPLNVILLDQNATPLELPKAIAENPLFIHQQVNARSVSAARNALLVPEAATWIVFCDDDGYVCEDYSEVLQSIIKKHPSLDIIAGSIKREDTGDYYSLRHKAGGSLTKFSNTKNLMGSNFACRASVYNELHRFDERFGAGSFWGSGEETDFCWKAFFANKKMEFFQELVVFHVPPFNESVKSGFRKAFGYGVGKGALVWKWLIIKREPKVLYELAEMFAVPLVQFMLGILKERPGLSVNYFGIFVGRVWGLIKAAFLLRA